MGTWVSVRRGTRVQKDSLLRQITLTLVVLKAPHKRRETIGHSAQIRGWPQRVQFFQETPTETILVCLTCSRWLMPIISACFTDTSSSFLRASSFAAVV